MTGSWADEKLSDLVDERGLDGYGFWWRLLEIIAEQTTNQHPPELIYSPQAWAAKFKARSDRVSVYFQLFANSGLISFCIVGTKWKVSVHNVLKYRDEYTERSGHAHEKVRAVSGPKKQIQSTEADTDASDRKPLSEANARATRDSKPTPQKLQFGTEKMKHGQPAWKWDHWQSIISEHPKRLYQHKGTDTLYFKAMETEVDCVWLEKVLNLQKANGGAKFIPGFEDWLNASLILMRAGLTPEQAAEQCEESKPTDKSESYTAYLERIERERAAK